MPRTNLRDSITPDMLQPGTRAKIIARNTFRYTAPDGAIVTRLHHTDVVQELGAGRYQLNSGGWKTPTTKNRINIGLRGYTLHQDAGTWYVSGGALGQVPFYDGMIVPDAFEKKGPRKKADAAELREKKLRAAIKKFARQLNTMPEIPQPSGGDCWLCCMRDPQGKSMGEHGNDVEHLREHVRENYLHGSLIVNAMRWAGYSDEGIRYYYSRAAQGDKSMRRVLARALRRYLYRKLGLVS